MSNFALSTKVLVPATSPIAVNAVFLNTYTGSCVLAGVSSPIPPPNQWQTLDLKPLGVPQNALAVELVAFLILTDGTQTKIADLAVAYQIPGGSQVPGNYANQVIAVLPTGGARTNSLATCPCSSGFIEWAWLRGDNGLGEWPDQPILPYPQGAAYGLNISVQKIFLP